jgi:hypothetical protein
LSKVHRNREERGEVGSVWHGGGERSQRFRDVVEDDHLRRLEETRLDFLRRGEAYRHVSEE